MALQLELPGLERMTEGVIVQQLKTLGEKTFIPGVGQRDKCDIPETDDNNQLCWVLRSEITRALFNQSAINKKDNDYMLERLKGLASVGLIEMKYIGRGNVPRFRVK